MKKSVLLNLSAILIFMTAHLTRAEEITAAVASNFSAPMKDIATQFKQDTGHTLKLTFGSSGKFYAQIMNGAPFHVFFSADQVKPKKLIENNQAVLGSQFTYARGALVLWSPQPDFLLEPEIALKQEKYSKLALANPKLAPYGQAALDVLRKLQLEELTRPKWVMGENISQTYQFVRSGNAELGFVALSQVMNQGVIHGGSYWVIPTVLYNPINQDAVILNRGEHSIAVKILIEYLHSINVRSVIESYGYTMDQSSSTHQ